MILDGHSDLLYDVTRRRLAGERRVLERRHLPLLRAGRIEGLMLSLWTSAEEETFWGEYPAIGDGWARTESMMRCAREELAQCPQLCFVRSAEEAATARAEGKVYAFVGVEGMEAIGDDLSRIDAYADFGARTGMLTWNEENLLATGAKGDPSKGLTALGRRALRRMAERGMLIDVSHLNERGFWDAIGCAETVVIASHSNCRALCDVPRNLTDEQLRAIARSGGTVGLNVYHGFIHAEKSRETVATLALHAAHMAEVMGAEHVACGFDFCEYFGPGNEGCRGMENASYAQNLFAELEALGFSAAEREGIARENLLRVLG
ncbi:MAG: membrane dipeptidase [Oscillibacter sp.]|nr:membrane dipeptidase [Oscillibacter sp.]